MLFEKNMNKKGQSAVEFMILVGAVLFFFVSFLIAVQINISDKVKDNKNTVLKETALTVQNEIAIAHKSVDGYSRNFNLPGTILGSEYGINIQGGLVYVRTTDGDFALALPVSNVTATGVNKGQNTITKQNGIVYLNPQGS